MSVETWERGKAEADAAPRGHAGEPEQRRTRRLALGGLLLLGAACWAHAEQLSPARQREILHEALKVYDQAVGVAREDPARAAQLYRLAAGGFQALVDGGVYNAGLEYDLGNSHFRLGDLGRAVLHYRRAERLAPGDARVDANLRYARGRVEPIITPSGEARLIEQVLFWHYQTALTQRFWAIVGFSCLGWPLLVAWLRWRRPALAWTGLAAVVLALLNAASIQWQLGDETRHPHAVAVQDRQPLRLGRGEGSDLALQQPLGAGVELRILQPRGAWVEVRLANGQTGWLPAGAVENL
jgi:tetratricopeptide (TPR) repeat protein